MQVSDMRALKTLYSQHLRSLASYRPPSLISCHNSPLNPRKFPHRKTIHSTSHRRNESGWTASNAWDNSNNHAGSRPEKTSPSGVAAVYDPISGHLVTRRGGPQSGTEDREPESSSIGGDEDAYKERTYGNVIRRESLGGGGSEKQGLGLGSGGRGVYVNRKKGKGKVAWVCSSCGHSEGQWWGACRACASVGTIVKFVEGVYDEGKTSGFEISENVVRTWLPNQGTETVPLRLTDVNRGVNQTEWRIPLPGLFGNEVARVLGGGLVPGSLVLVGGDPGVGKSTLLLQIAALIAEGHGFGKPAPVIYVSGEESVEQIGHRADRMTIETEELFLYSSTDIEDVFEKIQHLSPRALVIDSIQTVYLKGVTGSAGGLPQVKECTSALLRFAKKTSIPVLLIGHVTKTGDIAGPRVLEHIVDVVLYMEGEKFSSHRLLRSVKNRFGSTDELGVFEMSQLGLQAVSNPSEMFLSEQQSDSEVLAGLAVAAMMDGSRTFLIEIQALCVSGSSGSRQVNGVQASRADMIISVLKKQAGLKLQEHGIYLNVVSGVTLSETAGDLAVAAAICSSFLEFPIPNNVAFIGEIGLGGELRGVPRMEKRLNTVAKLGYKKCIVAESAQKSLAGLAYEGMTIVRCRNLKEMINTVFTSA
ncbi:uncharacterized protein LOC131299238 [Rhododendron vialii]|uniref:uncharacterized protein LOC131299238 n=1 Tax=Rhododendron vialii TaxID=182163 RepID=UPI00265E0D80|nr:uncharacterized protein LOC131299238 [Rhododendron vialii]